MDILRALQQSKPDASIVSEKGIFFTDNQADIGIQAEFESLYPTVPQSTEKAVLHQPAAWVDSDDENMVVDIYANTRLRKLRHEADERIILGDVYENRLRAQYEKLHPKPSWASEKKRAIPKNEIEKDCQDRHDDDMITCTNNELLHDLGKLNMNHVASQTGPFSMIPETLIDMTKLPDVNRISPSKCVIQSISFHPNGELIMTGGFDGTVKIFQIDEKSNPLLQSVQFKKFPIYGCHFLAASTQILLTSRRSYFYTFDLLSGTPQKISPRGLNEKSLERAFPSPNGRWIAFIGKNAYIFLFDAASFTRVASLKINGEGASSITFSKDDQYLFAVGTDHEIYQFDLSTFKCIARVVDQAGLRGTALAASSSALALGSENGIVNYYGLKDSSIQDPPLKSFMNLTTYINQVQFNHDGQLLAISSRSKKNALRLINTRTLKVYSNWPVGKTPLSYVNAIQWSPNSRYLAVGNDRGQIQLFKLNHYHL